MRVVPDMSQRTTNSDILGAAGNNLSDEGPEVSPERSANDTASSKATDSPSKSLCSSSSTSAENLGVELNVSSFGIFVSLEFSWYSGYTGCHNSMHVIIPCVNIEQINSETYCSASELHHLQ